jgi:type II secretory pathway component PulC
MKNTLELQLRKLALVLTVVMLLLLVWSGARSLLLADPDPILPAEASLRVDRLSLPAPADEEELSQSLAARPLFWQNRQPYVPHVDSGEVVAPVSSGGTGAIDSVLLQGVYTGAKPGIIISYKGERRRLSLGDAIEDWELTMMSPDSVIFESGSDSRTLSLEHALPAVVTKKRVRGKTAPKAVEKKDNRKKTGEKN